MSLRYDWPLKRGTSVGLAMGSPCHLICGLSRKLVLSPASPTLSPTPAYSEIRIIGAEEGEEEWSVEFSISQIRARGSNHEC